MKFKKMTQFFRGALVAALFLFGQSVYAQTVTVSGHVKDDLDLPVIGASVLEEGTTNGTITDYDGNFTLQVNANAKLTVSYVGYDSQTVEVNGKTQLVIKLSESSASTKEKSKNKDTEKEVVFNEKSITVELGGIPTEMVLMFAGALCAGHKAPSVLVKDFNTDNNYLIRS